MACGNIVQASNRVGFTKDLYELLCESGNHAFVSAQAFAEIYNTVFARHISLVDQKTRQDPHSGRRLKYLNEPQCQVFMTRKNTMEAFFNGELENELRDRKLVDTVSFSEDASREKVMKQGNPWNCRHCHWALPLILELWPFVTNSVWNHQKSNALLRYINYHEHIIIRIYIWLY